jgi:CBS domain containing-hemolysin-like protein
MTVAGHVLQPDEVIENDGLRFHIEKVERRRLLLVRLELSKKKMGQASEAVSGSAKAAG